MQRFIVMPEILRQVLGREFAVTPQILFASAVYATDEAEFAAAVRAVLPSWRGEMALPAVTAFVHARRIGLHPKFDERINPNERYDRNEQLELEDAVRWKIGEWLGIQLPLTGDWPMNKAARDRFDLVIERAQLGIASPDLDLSGMKGRQRNHGQTGKPLKGPLSAGEKARAAQAAMCEQLRERIASGEGVMPVVTDGRPVAPRHDHVDGAAGHRAHRPQRGAPVAGVGRGAESRAKNGGKKG